MHEYSACVAAGDLLKVTDIFDCWLEAMLLSLGASEEEVCRRCGDDHDV